jgi:hypothetical protein
VGLCVGVFGVTSDNSLRKNGGDDETRTRDLCRDSAAGIGFTTTYKTRGDCQTQSKSYKTTRMVGWVVGWKIVSLASGTPHRKSISRCYGPYR